MKTGINKVMKIKMSIIGFLLIIVFNIIIGCKSKNDYKEVSNSLNKCDETDKIDSLIQKIVTFPNLYNRFPDCKDNYLISNTLLITRLTYKGNYGKAFYFTKNILINEMACTIFIDSTNFKEDSTLVNVVVGYYPMYKYRARTMHITFEYDKKACNWSTLDTSEEIH